MQEILLGCVIDHASFKALFSQVLGNYYGRAEKVFLDYKKKEELLSFSVGSLLLRATEVGKLEELLQALEQATPKVAVWKGSHKKSPNINLINDIVRQTNLFNAKAS